ncbi:hypothetical protein KR009_010810, partial [Drosophila setifemur]
QRLAKTHWLSDYADDIFETMREQELTRRPLFFVSSQMDERQKMLHLLQVVTRAHKLNRCALHLAVYYLDRFIDQFTIRTDKLFLVALTCLHIAAQIENADVFIPRYSELNQMVMNVYSAFEYKAVERKILCFMNFELVRPTTASFVELFACRFLTRSDYATYNQMLDEKERELNVLPHQRYGSFEQMLADLAQLLLRMADYTLSITRFGNELPSLLAAACIAAVRQVSGVKRWTQYLIDLTSYTEAFVEPFIDVIVLYHYYQINCKEPIVNAEPPMVPHSWDPPSGQTSQSWSSPDSGFEESITANTGQLVVVLNKVVTVNVETYNEITVQLQDTDENSTTYSLIKAQASLKRPRSPGEAESPRPTKKPKLEGKSEQ